MWWLVVAWTHTTDFFDKLDDVLSLQKKRMTLITVDGNNWTFRHKTKSKPYCEALLSFCTGPSLKFYKSWKYDHCFAVACDTLLTKNLITKYNKNVLFQTCGRCNKASIVAGFLPKTVNRALKYAVYWTGLQPPLVHYTVVCIGKSEEKDIFCLPLHRGVQCLLRLLLLPSFPSHHLIHDRPKKGPVIDRSDSR